MRLFNKWFLACAVGGVLGLTGPSGWALINPNFTPRNLYDATKVLFQVGLSPAKDGKSVTVTKITPVLGEAPSKIELDLSNLEEDQLADFNKALALNPQAPGVVLLGNFQKAAGIDPTGPPPAGLLLVFNVFFNLLPGENGAYRVVGDTLDVRAIWAGTAEMLVTLVKDMQVYPTLDLPVKAGGEWGKLLTLGTCSKQAAQIHFWELQDKKPSLVIADPAGDQILSLTGTGTEVQAKAQTLPTKSLFLTALDVDGDGLLDLVGWDGKSLTLARQAIDGTFAARPVPGLSDCRSLGITGIRGRAAVIVGTANGPVVLAPEGASLGVKFQLDAKSLAQKEGLGDLGELISGDFEGLGRPGILQVCEKGAILFRGEPDGFSAATVANRQLRLPKQTGIALGDFNGDGRLDVVLVGNDQIAFLLNRGDDTFLDMSRGTGETAYAGPQHKNLAAVWDGNGDGTVEPVVRSPDRYPGIYFNRGYFSFGYSNDRMIEETDPELGLSTALSDGQTAGTTGDVNGDSLADAIFLTPEGAVVAVPSVSGASTSRPASLDVALPPSSVQPTLVTAYHGKRCLGARWVLPGVPANFALPTLMPVKLVWKTAAPEEQQKTVPVLKRAGFRTSLETK